MSANDSKLGSALRGAPGAKLASKLAITIAGAVHYEPWIVPRLNVECAITLVAFDRREEIEAAVWERMRFLKLDLNPTTEQHYELARARRFAAYAVVDRNTHEPIGTVDDWGLIDDDIIGAFWSTYGDLREALDPAETPLTVGEMVAIVETIKKKHGRLLRFIGVRKLAAFLLSMDDQQVASLSQSCGATSSPLDSLPSVESPPATPPADS